jgi:hypothetical protein
MDLGNGQRYDETLRDFQQLERELMEFAYWKDRRDELIQKALAAGMAVERVSAVMGVSSSTIRRVTGQGH